VVVLKGNTTRPGGNRAYAIIGLALSNSGQSQPLGVLLGLPQLKRLLVAEDFKNNIANFVHESAHNNLVRLGFTFFFIVGLKYGVSGWSVLLRSNSGDHRQVKQGSNIGGAALGQFVF